MGNDEHVPGESNVGGMGNAEVMSASVGASDISDQNINSGSSSDTSPTLSPSERDAVYNRLIHEAPYVPGDSAKLCSVQDIEWFNPFLVSEGQRFIQRNFFALICAHLGALLYGFSFKRLSTVLLRTGKSHDVTDSMVRYLSTFVHFKDWYTDGIKSTKVNTNNNIIRSEVDSTFRGIQKVRAMHRHALRICLATPLPTNEDFIITDSKLQVVHALTQDLQHIPTSPVPSEILTYSPQITMSQFDMVMTQFGLIGLLYMFPVTLGVRDSSGLRGFLHLWAIFGRLLGIEDRFNIALFPDQELYRRLFTDVGLASLKDMDVRIFTLQKSLLDGFGKFTYFGSIKSFLFYGLYSKEALPTFEGTNLYKLLSWTDWCYYIAFKCILTLYYQFGLFHNVVDCVAKFVVEFHAKIYLKRRKRQGS